MKLPVRLTPQQTRAAAPLVAVMALQAVAALFFLGETFPEARSSRYEPSWPTETVVATALLVGFALAARDIRSLLRRSSDQASALAIVRATFSHLLIRQFDLWRLTPAERDIARLSLEGLDVEEIGKIRSAATGTIRAQFASIFLTELVGTSVQAPQNPISRTETHL